jgi:multiple sugar transport system substrate-binding protein
MLCSSLGEDPFLTAECVVNQQTGIRALTMLRELAVRCPPACFSWNPIATYEAMSSESTVAYCPFAFAYCHYARRGYAPHLLEFTRLINWPGRRGGRSILGGTGLAISVRCRHKEKAAEYARFVASAECQRTLYFEGGASRPTAWLGWTQESTRSPKGFSSTRWRPATAPSSVLSIKDTSISRIMRAH